MDAPTKFFFSLEKKQGQSKFMHGLKSTTDVLLTADSDIRRRAADFYADLYSSEYSEDEDSFNDFCSDLPRVSVDFAKELGEPMTLEEIHAALQSMEGGKAPGIDGLPSEFYRAFWSDLCVDLLEVFEESFAEGFLPQSCRRAVLTLLPKKGDLQEIKNWRPVSLLCTDYKLLSKVLANRLKKVMEQVVHQTQTYCVPGRSMIDNISLIRDVLDVSRSLGCNTGLVSLDQEKAFDRVEHRYLWRVLERFGLDSSFIAKIMVLYENIESVLKINGCLCKPFKVTRGVRQGCSLSGMLYALSIEPLLKKIRSNIEGLVFPSCNVSFTLSAYADDVIIIVKNQEEVNHLGRIVELFCKLSAARVNWVKSEALAIGSWFSGLPQLPGGLKWKRGGLKYLGVYLGDEDTEKKNWEGVMEKVEGRLAKWRWLLPQMSYRGRVLIINNLIASLLWHKLACLEPPVGLLTKIQSCMIKFFWDDKHWVSQAVLFLPKEEGGQGLVHLESRTAAFRLQFIQKYLMGREEDILWKPITSIILKRVGGLGLDVSLFLLNCKMLLLYEMPMFYKSLFRAWTIFEWKRIEPTVSLFWLLEEPLIFEARLALEDRVGLSRRLLQKKVLKLRHIVETAGSGLQNTEATASLLGLKSIRVMRTILDLWLGKLTLDEKQMLVDFCNGEELPDSKDPFPEMGLNIDFSELTGHLLIAQKDFVFCMLIGKYLYKLVVQGLNKKQLSGRTDTVWRDRFKVGDNQKPIWRVFYKPPLSKRVSDLQWRILHGAISVNSFIVKFRKDLNELCPFCEEVETIFHMFLECKRLSPLFFLFEDVFKKCGVYWSEVAFIFGAGYTKKESSKWNLLNFLIGQAKFSIYISRRNKLNGVLGENVDRMFILMVKHRVKAEFMFFSLMNNLMEFFSLWCFNNVICSVFDRKLVFNSMFA
ncbi:tyrosine-protein kinase SYK isoform X1 [Xiphophorus maculatus]|uniref:tyrosine-protein kinase SYK isoform X1 n=1 Tax=Xiphophorus maculatus TaxID=8083 RepID=UPI000C6CFDD6|nr:tyrosine-protein kinase SYK isoform X1 [Xiphophorus maculatus]